jgi:hypothetical protein
MAKLVCVVHYDPTKKKVMKTWKVLSTVPEDTVQIMNSDSAPFVIQAENAENAAVAIKLGLLQAPNTNGQCLYQAPEVETGTFGPHTIGPVPAWLKLPCGTTDPKGNFISWGGFGPDGYNDDDA